LVFIDPNLRNQHAAGDLFLQPQDLHVVHLPRLRVHFQNLAGEVQRQAGVLLQLAEVIVAGVKQVYRAYCIPVA
jgi:hypothetical protein